MAFQGSLTELPLPDIIQLVSVSGKTGIFSLTRGGHPPGEIFLRGGQIVHATVGDIQGEEAIYELAIWPEGDFLFTPGKESAFTSVRKSNTNLLMEAARRIDEWQILSKKIPSTRMIPVFTNTATTTSVSLTPQEWAVICKVDERRTIDEVALTLGQSAFETSKLLYGLITSGLISLKEVIQTDRLEGLGLQGLADIAGRIGDVARGLLGASPRSADLDRLLLAAKSEVDSGRGPDAVVDLIRGAEGLVTGALGPNQSKAFLDRVTGILGGTSSA
ncbi:MAG: DUF4388 domain-containing protein [Acidobacteriota bacterium]